MSAEYEDFQGFRDWYRLHRRRQTGRTASEHTLRTKSIYLARAARETDSTDEELLANVLTDPSAVGRLLRMWDEAMSPGAARVAVYALLNFAEYAVAKGWLASVHDACVGREDVPPRNPKPPIVVYSAEEMEAFVTAARGVDVRWWALITFLVDTGRRIGETLDIEWEWLRLDAEPAYVEFPFTKNGEPQYVPLTRRLQREVFTPENIAWMKSNEKAGHMAFRRSIDKHPFPWNYGTAKGRFERFCERSGLPDRGFHCFRHTVITERLARGVPLQAVSKLAGHSSVAVTDSRYNHADSLAYARYIERDVGNHVALFSHAPTGPLLRRGGHMSSTATTCTSAIEAEPWASVAEDRRCVREQGHPGPHRCYQTDGTPLDFSDVFAEGNGSAEDGS